MPAPGRTMGRGLRWECLGARLPIQRSVNCRNSSGMQHTDVSMDCFLLSPPDVSLIGGGARMATSPVVEEPLAIDLCLSVAFGCAAVAWFPALESRSRELPPEPLAPFDFLPNRKDMSTGFWEVERDGLACSQMSRGGGPMWLVAVLSVRSAMESQRAGIMRQASHSERERTETDGRECYRYDQEVATETGVIFWPLAGKVELCLSSVACGLW